MTIATLLLAAAVAPAFDHNTATQAAQHLAELPGDPQQIMMTKPDMPAE